MPYSVNVALRTGESSCFLLGVAAWLDRLERKLGWIAIPGLVRIVVLFNALVYLLFFLNPGYVGALALDPDRVLSGEVWRLVSYIFIPPNAHPVFILFALWFLWMLGEGLEQEWGSFKLTLFYLVGMIGTTLSAFLTGGATTNVYLNLSLLFAFATFFPNHTILFMLIIPLKIKWVAFISLFFVVGALLIQPIPYKLAILVAMANYLIFFGPGFVRQWRERSETSARRSRFDEAMRSDREPLYECVHCGKTDLSNPEEEFRVADDGFDYCAECLADKKAGE